MWLVCCHVKGALHVEAVLTAETRWPALKADWQAVTLGSRCSGKLLRPEQRILISVCTLLVTAAAEYCIDRERVRESKRECV